MANKDGSIYFSVEIDNKDAYKKLDALEKKIEELQNQLSDDTKKRDYWLTQADALAKPLDDAKQKLAQMKEAGKGVFSSADINAQKENVASLEAAWENAIKKAEHYVNTISKGEAAIDKTKKEAKELTTQIAAAEKPTARMVALLVAGDESAQKLKKRVTSLVASALVFSTITKAFTLFREHAAAVIQSNEEAAAALSRLKGAMLTMVQPLIEVVLPSFVDLVNVLTAVATRVGQVMAMLFGTTTENASKAAQALYEETQALEETGAAAKKASGQLASFDEINQLSSTGSGTPSALTAPDFSWGTEMSEGLLEIADAVFLIAAGFTLWKITDKLVEPLGFVGKTLSGMIITMGGLLILWNGLNDVWENGLDWSNMAAVIAGVAASAAGVSIAFGRIGGGITLILGGLALLVTGFQDVIDTGVNLQNTLLAIAGIVATGLGFFLLTGSVIPLVIAAIGSIVYALVAFAGNADQLVKSVVRIFEGIRDFLWGFINGDLSMMGEGIWKIVSGLVLSVLNIAGGVINAIIKGLNWLIRKINSISFNVPDWVPIIGGKGFAPKIKTVEPWVIPQLAQGAVIPPNREFLAVLGDQSRGNNIEAPEDLIRKIVREESGGMNEELLRAILAAIQAGQTIVMDGEKVARNQVRHINNMSVAAGKPVLIL